MGNNSCMALVCRSRLARNVLINAWRRAPATQESLYFPDSELRGRSGLIALAGMRRSSATNHSPCVRDDFSLTPPMVWEDSGD
jgi:hypothetical protein